MQPGEATNLALYLQSGKYFKPAIWGSAMIILKKTSTSRIPQILKVILQPCEALNNSSTKTAT